MTLTLEVKETPDMTAVFGTEANSVLLTPPIDEDYWMFRVKVGETQAVVGFGKFGTVGIGFAQEEDWNTNLPSSCHTEDIYHHILHNKGDASIPDADVREAIRMIQHAAAKYQGREVREDANGDLMTATADGRFMDRYLRKAAP